MLLGLPAVSAMAQTNTTLSPLNTAAEVRLLSPEEANRHHPVHIHGVVTFLDHSNFVQFVQDDTAGVYFMAPDAVYSRP